MFSFNGYTGVLKSTLGLFLLLGAVGCFPGGGTHVSPGLPCATDIPEGIDPTLGVTYDPSHIVCVQVEMDETDFDAMAAQSRDLLTVVFACDEPLVSPYTWFEANILVDGIALDGVGIRKKGTMGSVLDGGMIKPALKIKTSKFIDDQKIGDTKRITLNNAVQDEARMRTCLAYEVFTMAGYPAPRANLANVTINGQHLGAYVHVEPMKSTFLEREFGDSEGAFYEGTATDFIEAWLPRWEIENSITDDEYLPVRSIAQALQGPDDELLDALEPLLNVDRFITYWALEALIGHVDGYSSTRNNFYLYFDPTDDNRGVFLPWGADQVFVDSAAGSQGTGLATFTIGELSRRFSRVPELNEWFLAELERLLDEVWDVDTLLANIDRYAAQTRAAEQNDLYEETLTQLRTWIQGREEQLRSMITEGLPANLEETSACVQIF
jgi:spore coat protein H